jgi:hypothetical protein
MVYLVYRNMGMVATSHLAYIARLDYGSILCFTGMHTRLIANR